MDIRYAIRVLLKSRGITLVAVVALALGIGVNTAIFSVVNAVLFRPLPYSDPARLVTVLRPDSNPVAAPDFLEFRDHAHSFEHVGAAEGWSASLTGRDAPEQIRGLHLSEDMFAMLGVAALRGRTFSADDLKPGSPRVLVISYALWQRSFAASADIVGQKVQLDRESYTVIGIMPPEFEFAPFWITQAEMWAPLDLSQRKTQYGSNSIRVFARLKPNVRLEQAQAEADQIAGALAAAYPATNARMKIVVEPLTDKALGKIRPALEVMLGAVGMVLLIACANVANLALARAASRQKEIAIRLALGARRSRIARQFLTESVVLSLCGGALGLVLAHWGIQGLRAMLRPDVGGSSVRLLRWDQIALDLPVLLFTLGLALLTGILSGIAPAFSASRGVGHALKEAGRGSSAGTGAVRFRKIMVAAEIAVSLVLLVGAGLLMRSFLKLRAVDPGFDSRNVLTMTVSVAGRSDSVGQARENLYRTIIERVEAVPGVLQASMTNHLPIAGDWWGTDITVDGAPKPLPGQEINTVFRVTRPGYFSVMRVPILKGRDFTERDSANAPAVVIINETLARHIFSGHDPLGKRISSSSLGASRTIVGVIKDIKQNSWGDPPANEAHIPFLQNRMFLNDTHPWTSIMTLVVRTRVDPEGLAQAVKRAAWSVDRDLPLSEVQTLDHAIGNATWGSRFSLMLVSLFSGLALLLAMIGIYGVMAYEVTQRTHEIGIRIALGAGSRGILGLIARQSLSVALAGVGCGLFAAAGLVRLMRTMLYQIDVLDPATFAAVATLMLLVGMAAALIPARRATRVDPMVALRNE